jgi:VWFA-related protein
LPAGITLGRDERISNLILPEESLRIAVALSAQWSDFESVQPFHSCYHPKNKDERERNFPMIYRPQIERKESRAALFAGKASLILLIFFSSSILAEAQESKEEKAYQLKVPVNLVLVPVSVEDPDGNLIAGLGKNNFEITENGIPQKITYFSMDPSPLSAAILIDRSIDEHTQSLLKKDISAIVESFSGFDEVALYEYLTIAHKIQDFTFDKEAIVKGVAKIPFLEDLKYGSFTGPPAINGKPIGTDMTPRPPQTLRTPYLDGAIGVAARHLLRRPNYFRKMILVVSSGYSSLGDHQGFQDTKKIILNHGILVYGMTSPFARIFNKTPFSSPYAEMGLIPGLLAGIAQMFTPGGREELDPLGRYTRLTGGETLYPYRIKSFTDTIHKISQAGRNQYVLGYEPPHDQMGSEFKSIQVTVHGSETAIGKILHRTGYYSSAVELQAN